MAEDLKWGMEWSPHLFSPHIPTPGTLYWLLLKPKKNVFFCRNSYFSAGLKHICQEPGTNISPIYHFTIAYITIYIKKRSSTSTSTESLYKLVCSFIRHAGKKNSLVSIQVQRCMHHPTRFGPQRVFTHGQHNNIYSMS